MRALGAGREAIRRAARDELCGLPRRWMFVHDSW